MINKLDRLKDILKGYQKVAIAYSGGCDSHFLFSVAVETLGKDNVLAISCIGNMMSKQDRQDIDRLLQGYQYIKKDIDVFSIDAFVKNDKKRCYFCKKTLMSEVKAIASEHGFSHVLDGQNLDDQGTYRPGIQACHELGILSPIKDANMTKEDVRHYSYQLGIETHDKPSNSCLASRYDYGEHLTLEKLDLVDLGEKMIRALNIQNVRLRVQDELARIEVNRQDFDKILNHPSLIDDLKSLGLKYITLDLEGIKSGSYDK